MGPVASAPATSTQTASPAVPLPVNGNPHTRNPTRGVPALMTAAAASSEAAEQSAEQGKPKGKAGKGGKLAKNDVAKGQKKKGGDKENHAQTPKAPQGQGVSFRHTITVQSFLHTISV